MSCTNCFDNCGNKLTSDKCVKYTGEDKPEYDICSGDSLYKIVETIFAELDLFYKNTSILTTSSCSFIDGILGGKDKTIQNLIDALIQGECTLKQLYDSVSNIVNAPFVVPTSCLTLPTSPTRDDVLKSLITFTCNLQSELNIIKLDYVKGTQLNSLISLYLQSIGINTTPTTPSTKQYLKYPEYVALPYHGSLSNFSSNGTGLGNYDKIYVCLGQTVTSSSGAFTLPDYRGRSPIGSTLDFTLNNIDSDVNPTLPQNANFAISQNQKIGKFTHSLNFLENGQHNHTITDNKHSHSVNLGRDSTANGGFGNFAKTDNNNAGVRTGDSLSNITLADSGNGDPHNNTHPVLGTIFVMYIP